MKTAHCLFQTPLGLCGIAWAEPEKPRGPPAVIAFTLPDATPQATESRVARYSGERKPATPPARIAALIKKVRRHLKGELQDFQDTAIDLDRVSAFERQVYEAVRAIPAGQTRTYGELAASVDRPAAARAVGRALGRNPIGLIIPCHRVLAAGGKPGGFSAHGGGATKTRMLAIEGISVGLPATIKSQRELQRVAALLKTRDPKLARCLAMPVVLDRRPQQSPYATLFGAIVHQQLSPKAASTILGRIKALYPDPAIPMPAAVLKTSDRLLRAAGLSTSKTRAVKDLAAKTLDGTVPSLEKIVTLSDGEIVRRLTAIHGVGRWTVEMLLIFSLRRMDVFPVDDYALRKVIAEVYGMRQVPTLKQLYALAESWRPYRTVASLYLWNFINSTRAPA